MAVATPASRNARCPCGSGLRFKDCHGNIAAPQVENRLARARSHRAEGDQAQALRICEDILDAAPGDVLALQLAAECEYDGGRPAVALELALRAARALPAAGLPPAEAYQVWNTLNRMFTAALAGIGTRAASALREAYRQMLDADREGSAASGSVGIVLVVPATATPADIDATLASVIGQAARPGEIVVATVGQLPDAVSVHLHERCATLSRPARLLESTFSDFATAANAGLAAVAGDWLLVLSPPHALAPNHLASLLGAMRDTAEWGFSACDLDPPATLPAGEVARATAATRALQQSIVEADTVGFALINTGFVGVAEGAVLFSRGMVRKVGGFRPMAGHEMWDFAMRALWFAEPRFTAEPTYRHRTLAGRAADANAAQLAQLQVFGDYYHYACDDAQDPPNRFAPSLGAWGLHALKRIFQTGHVLAFDVATLAALAARVIAAAESARAPVLTTGINFVGFAFGEFGLGESLRALARSADSGGIPFMVKDVDQRLKARQADRSIEAHVGDTLRHKVSLLCLNPDMLTPVLPIVRDTREGGGRNVGYWYWELETIPKAWADGLAAVDEIWCATEFIAGALRRATDKPVIKIPPPIEVRLERAYARADFSLPAGRFLFLFTFDFNSFASRKNPEAAVRAFRQAFPEARDDVGLVVKSINGTNRPELVAALNAVIAGDPRIVPIDGFLSRDEAYGLISVCDAYVSLHRSEGLGLGLAEAMYLGKPVVATAYSGNLEFMHEGNSALVPYRMVPVRRGEYLYDDDRFVWAEADVDAAAGLMRRLVDDVPWREALAVAGQAEIRTRFTRERTAAGMRARLEQLGLADVAGGGRPRFVSYAQHGEDALLYQALLHVQNGRYIDVGAHDPDLLSVTKAFYERGWSGINVEPVTEQHARLASKRPRDVNLAVACGSHNGEAMLGEIRGTGLSTLDADTAQRHERHGFAVEQHAVPMLTLDTVWQRHVRGEVHFLKIDVEGWEADVLAGLDLERHRPWIVVVEAVAPLTGQPTWAAWEGRLLASGYLFAHDDGLNRYYVAKEHSLLTAAFECEPPMEVQRAVERIASEPGLGGDQIFEADKAEALQPFGDEPTLAAPTSQLCTEAQFRETAYARWVAILREPPILHRKQWEFVYLLQVLEAAGMLAPGRRGLGFGCGREPLSAAMAARGCEVIATDLEADTAHGRGWIETDQHAARLEDLNDRAICPPGLFAQRARFRPVDMNAIPGDLDGFDFVWSSCAFEHLGSLEHGLAFVRRAMECLRPGGIAVHTTEFNLSSNLDTVQSRDLSVFRRQDIERLFRELADAGDAPSPLNLNPGAGPVDRYVDLPPYRSEPHLKLRLSRYAITSIGLIVRRGG